MHPFPAREALIHWIGAEIGQIIIDPYQVRFELDGISVLATITVSEPFLYRHDSGEDEFDPENGPSEKPIRFHALIKQKLSALDVAPDGDQMTLQFENGQALIIRSEVGGPYESGTITDQINGGTFWVF